MAVGLPIVVIIIVGGLICVVAAIQVITMISSTGFTDAQTAANLSSGSAELSAIIPGIAIILGIGVLGKLLGK